MKTRIPPAGKTTPAQKYLALIRKRVRAIRRDISHMTELGEQMAKRLLAGGNIFAARVCRYWPGEFGGRSGGLMCLRGRADCEGDVALFPVPDLRTWQPNQDRALRELLEGKASLYVIGRPEDVGDLAGNPRFSGFTGGVGPEQGLYRFGPFEPFARVRPFEQLVRGWITTGEMICACLRGGKMPIIWLSVWLEGAYARNSSFMYSDRSNLVEPAQGAALAITEMFHHQRYVPPLPRGYAAREFLSVVDMLVDSLERQGKTLAKIGRWLAEARQSGKRVGAVLAGHTYPRILGLPKDDDRYPVQVGPTESVLANAVPKDFGPGDVFLYLGYAPVQDKPIRDLLDRGIRLIHTSPYGLPADTIRHKDLLWFDLPWRPADAVVDVPGYGARILPSNSTAHELAYNAILCELAEALGMT